MHFNYTTLLYNTMSFTSQPTNSRSMNGIISFDDGNGGVLENGDLICNNINADEQIISNLEISNRLDLVGNLNVNTILITPTWLSYLYGLTGNIQNQISSITSNLLATANTWTAKQTFGNGALTQYLNTNTVYPTRSTSAVGGIMGHTFDTKALHIVNANSNLTSYENAIMFDKLDTSSSMVNLMRISNDGNLYLPYSLGSNSISTEFGTKQNTLSAINKLNASYIGTTGNVSNTEYDYLENVTSDIQTQFNTKQNIIDSSNRLNASYIGTTGNVSNTEYDYLGNVTSDIQTQLNTKQNIIDSSNRLNASYIGTTGNVSNTEYDYLGNVTSDIQTQLNTKPSLSGINTWTNTQTFNAYTVFDTGFISNGTASTDIFNINDEMNSYGISVLNRQFATITVMTTSTTYTSSNLPSIISCNSSTILTVTLPTASSIGSGFLCTIMNISVTDDLNINTTSNCRYNSIPWPNPLGSITVTTSLVLQPGQTVNLISNPSIWSVL